MLKFSESTKGTYVGVRFMDETIERLQQLQNKLNLPNPTPGDKLHSTIVYSRKGISFKPNESPGLIAMTKNLHVFETQTGARALVVMLDSPYLKFRHEYGNRLGATYDFNEYLPHITLSYDIGALDFNHDVSGIPIEMAAEYVTDLDLDWSDKD